MPAFDPVPSLVQLLDELDRLELSGPDDEGNFWLTSWTTGSAERINAGPLGSPIANAALTWRRQKRASWGRSNG